jgi:thiol:disulfide interchange protein DsbD
MRGIGTRSRLFFYIALACLFMLSCSRSEGRAGGKPQTTSVSDEKVGVQVKLSQEDVHDSSDIFVALALLIEPGWHINSASPLDENLIPTSIEVAPSVEVALQSIRYPKGVQKRLGFSEGALDVYEGKVYILLKLHVKSGVTVGKHHLEAAITYQACNQSICLAPSVLRVEIPLHVVPRSVPLKQINSEVFGDFTN